MQENESIKSMITRLQTLLNSLRSLRNCNYDVNDKILCTPQKSREHKIQILGIPKT